MNIAQSAQMASPPTDAGDRLAADRTVNGPALGPTPRWPIRDGWSTALGTAATAGSAFFVMALCAMLGAELAPDRRAAADLPTASVDQISAEGPEDALTELLSDRLTAEGAAVVIAGPPAPLPVAIPPFTDRQIDGKALR